MKNIVIIKLGGSLVTDKAKPFKAREEVIKKIADDIAYLHFILKNTSLIIGNGGGSFGHYSASLYKNKLSSPEGFSIVQDSVERLNRIIVNKLLSCEIPACSLHPSSLLIISGGKKKRIFLDSMFGLLKLGIVPVFYGDIIYDKKLGAKIYSTEKLFSLIVPELQKKNYNIDKIIQMTSVEGVLDKSKKVIPSITIENFPTVKTNLFSTEGVDVTGGMLHKIETSLENAKKGIKTIILKGDSKDGRLVNAVLGKKFIGTTIT